MKHEVT